MKHFRFLANRSQWLAVVALCLLPLVSSSLAQPAARRAGAANLSEPPLQPGAENIQGILVVPRYEDVKPEGVTGIKGVMIKGPAFLQQRDFEKMLRPYLGLPFTKSSLDRMQTNIIRYCRAEGHLLVDVFYREQDIQEGTIQIGVVEAKVGKVTVANPGHKWFSDSLVLREVRLKPGDAVIEHKLNDDLAWLNRNNYTSLGYDNFAGSFRSVSARFMQHGSDPDPTKAELGKTDVELQVADRIPVRAFAGADDTGIEVIGRDRVFAGGEWANAFGLDHRLNYEYITDTGFANRFREHVTSYVVPLPWRHELTLFGAYAEVRPDFTVVNPNLGNLKNDGSFYQISGRYSVPLPSMHKYEHEATAGFDFKRTDTPLLFEGAGSGVLRTNQIDVAQFSLSYSGRRSDRLGRTTFALLGVFSPGSLTSHNHKADYQDFAAATDPRYLYAQAEVRRETMLPYGFSWFTRAKGQIADAKLVATETFSIGGFDTVRGYDERIVGGDNGWLIVNELRTPQITLGNLTGKPQARDWLQALIFCDYGGALNRHPLVQQRYEEVLLSVGLGFRYEVADNFRVRFDYGFQLDQEYLTGPNAALLGNPGDRRAHFGVELSF